MSRTMRHSHTPPLEWSSDSGGSDVDDSSPPHPRTPTADEAASATSPAPAPDTGAILRSVAAVHLRTRRLRLQGDDTNSPTTPSGEHSLRDRLKERARVHLRRRRRPLPPVGSSGATSWDHGSHVGKGMMDQPGGGTRAIAREVTVPPTEHRHDHSPTPRGGDTREQRARSRLAPSEPVVNRVFLHVYDLIEKDTLVMLPPFGCVVEIGQCFVDMNTALHAVGTGAYHVGVEINGVEYAYGACSNPHQTGVFTCFPRLSPGYQYRTTIDLGARPLVRRTWVATTPEQEKAECTSYRHEEEYVDGRTVVKEMAKEYMGTDYDILRKNCCTFARDACLRLGVPEDDIPVWFGNLADSGAVTQDAVRATIEPLSSVLSLAYDDDRTSTATAFFPEATAMAQEAIETIFQSRDDGESVVVEDSPGPLCHSATWSY